jgi:hypothetical protein
MIMKRAGVLTKSLAAIGTVLVGFPILAPLLLMLARVGSGRPMRIDWLIPAELFPLALVGAVLLLVAAFRAGSRKKTVGLGIVAAVVGLGGGMILTAVSGLASGRTEPEGWLWALVVVPIALYTAAVVELTVAGALLIGDVFRRTSVGDHPDDSLRQPTS